VPPDVPPEYADAYLAGFRRAYDEGSAAAAQEEDGSRLEPTDEDAERSDQWEFEPPEQAEEQPLDWAFEPPEEAVHEAPPEWEFEPPEVPAEEPDDDDWPFAGQGEAIPEADGWEDEETRDEASHLVPGFGPDEGSGGSTAVLGESRRGVPWVTVVLAVLIVVLIVGAFLLGKALSGTVSDSAPRCWTQRSGESSTRVTGPSLTRLTCMSAPNSPRVTVAPSRSSSAQTLS